VQLGVRDLRGRVDHRVHRRQHVVATGHERHRRGDEREVHRVVVGGADGEGEVPAEVVLAELQQRRHQSLRRRARQHEAAVADRAAGQPVHRDVRRHPRQLRADAAAELRRGDAEVVPEPPRHAERPEHRAERAAGNAGHREQPGHAIRVRPGELEADVHAQRPAGDQRAVDALVIHQREQVVHVVFDPDA